MAKTIKGTAKADTITVTESDVTVNAGLGNDTITVTRGSRNVIHGDAGNDTIVVKSSAGTDNEIYGDAGDDMIKAQAGTNKITVYGGDGADIIYGGSGSDRLYGQGGKDKLYGGAGADRLYGGSGNDMLYGQAGNDILQGYNGNDRLYGGSGNDKLYGGAGKDTFVYSDGKDIIYDYETGEDAIKLADDRLKNCVVRGKDVQLTLKDGGLITVKNTAGKQIELIDESGQSHYITPVSQQSVIKQVMKSLDNATTTVAATAVNAAVNKASGGMFGTYTALINRFIHDVKNYGGTEKSEYGEGWEWKRDESSNKFKQVPMPGTDKFLKDFCGIDLTNDDTGSMSGYDVGGTKVKTAENIMPGKDLLADAKYPSSKTTTINGLTIHWPDKSSLNSSQKMVVAGLYSYLTKAALDLVKESYGISYADSDVLSDLKHMTLSFFNDSTKPVASAGATQLNVNMYYFSDLDDTTWYWDNLGRTMAHEFTHGVMNANLDPWLWYNLASDNRFTWLVEGLAELTQGLDDTCLQAICELSQVANASELEKVLGNNSTDVSRNHYNAGYMVLRYLAKQVVDNSWHSKLPQGITGDSYLTNVTISSEAKGTFDVLYYGNKIKTINFDKGSRNVKVLANDLQNVIHVNGTENTASGDDGDDVIVIESGNKHTASGGKGNDSITVSKNAGTGILVYGEAGNDVIKASNSYGVIINGGAGNDLLYGGSGKDEIYGSAGNDEFYGQAGNDKLYGGIGNDDFSGGAGNDYLSGGSGDDKIYGNAGKDTLYGGEGNDYLSAGAGDDELYGNAGKDTLYGGEGNDYLSGGAGNDYISGNAGSDRVYGGDGNDEIYGGAGKDYLSGGYGSDKLYGGEEDDEIYGAGDNDHLSGGAGNDKLYGGEGDDTMEGGIGENTFQGGAGRDRFRFFSTTGSSIDTVLDYKAGLDIIEFGDSNLSIASSEVKEGNVTLHMNGGGTINIVNAAGQEITFYSKEQGSFTRIFS